VKALETLTDVSGKRVLVRVDWNVPLKDGKVQDDFRIRQSLPTVQFLMDRGAKVILISHLEPEEASLQPVYEHAKTLIPKLSWDDDGDVTLLENLRHNPGEKGNDPGFAASLASLGDIYVNEAFSVSHREHASVVSVPKLLPSYAGLRFMDEVKNLSRFFNPEHPFLFILGGAKFDTKLPLLKKFVNIADKIFVGGALAHNFFLVEGKNVGDSVVSKGDFDLAPLLATGKIILPENLRVKSRDGMGYDTIDHVGDRDMIVDAGPKDIEKLKGLITEAKIVLWNGPLGYYEQGFTDTTVELAKAIAESGKITVLGGADTITAISSLGLEDKYTFVSSAGGAMLDYLANETLPGIEALKEHS
jgi:phosphoglycerate kinase